eukprot:TRINITY_DN8560_c0_g1_i1.p1 TRINITY_DN8560_c0_g1~~TRINITY_DN8560_c0_g1_i1.p1  ORF type:complete len:500 (+),score=96.87 TRINITY_DN8560_c0_g1_i1:43-1542(+)
MLRRLVKESRLRVDGRRMSENPREKTAVIAMGSNLESVHGDREKTLRKALHFMSQSCGDLLDTSFLYSTPPSIVTDQPMFLNAACLIRTRLPPHELLKGLKVIESNFGRNHSAIRYGPRPLDLDIVFYEDEVLDDEKLTIPHPRFPERDFVLGPVMDICPDLVHPLLGEDVRTLWDTLPSKKLAKVFPTGINERLWHLGERTNVMGIVNVTPDSFSGDGLLSSGSSDWVSSMLKLVENQIKDGADVIDIGAHSTKPTYSFVSTTEETKAVCAAISAIRKAGFEIPISIDTFRASVAEAALSAGANIINDVWGASADPRMKKVAAEKGSPIIVMHNGTLMDPNIQRELAGLSPVPPTEEEFKKRVASYSATNHIHIVQEVGKSLDETVHSLIREGVPRWGIMVDPGVGFGKSVQSNLELIRSLRELKSMTLHMPVLLGPSRKSFIGKILKQDDPSQRLEGTLACIILGSERGADFVRVHDVKEAKRSLQISDAILRGLRT